MRLALLADAASVHSQRWARALLERGWEVAIWSERPWIHAPEAITVHPIPISSGRGVLQSARRLRRELAIERPDLVHAHYVSRYGLYGALAGIHPLVMSVWGADVEVFPRAHYGLNRYVLSYVFARADAITASSHYLAQVTGRLTSAPITVIPFGIDLRQFTPQQANTGPLRWIINKALEPVYGIDWLLTLWRTLTDVGPWEGRILGEGSAREDIQRLIDQGNLQDRIKLMGRVEPADLPKILAWADVGLYPSRRESFGVAPLEMAALGRAVIANRLGGLPEVVEDGITGFLAEPEDRVSWQTFLKRAIQNPESLRSMGERGPGFVERQYDFLANVESMETLYRTVVRQGKGRGTMRTEELP